MAANLACADERLVLAYLAFFLLGYVQYLRMRRGLSAAEALAWTVACMLVCWHQHSLSTALIATVAAGAITLPWPRMPTLAFLGTISYSLYLLHWIIGTKLLNLATRLHSDIAMYAALVVAIVVSLGCATLFWAWVERPFVKLSRQISGAQRDAIAAAPGIAPQSD